MDPRALMLAGREFEAACEQGRVELRAACERELAPAHQAVHEVLDGDDASIRLFGVRESIALARLCAAERALDYYIAVTAEPESYDVPICLSRPNGIKPGRMEWRVEARTGSQEGPVAWSATTGDPVGLVREAAEWVRAGRSLERWAR